MDKNQTALNSVTSMREATAATAQLEQAKRMIDEDERELSAIGQRLVEANHLATERERIAAELETAQSQARDSLSADQQEIESRARQWTPRGIREVTKPKRVPRRPADALRSHPVAQASPRVFSSARQLVRQLRHRPPAAAAQHHVEHRRDGNLRGVWCDAVRGGLMVVGRQRDQ